MHNNSSLAPSNQAVRIKNQNLSNTPDFKAYKLLIRLMADICLEELFLKNWLFGVLRLIIFFKNTKIVLPFNTMINANKVSTATEGKFFTLFLLNNFRPNKVKFSITKEKCNAERNSKPSAEFV